MAKLTPTEIKNILVQAGIPEQHHDLMVAVAMAESSGDPNAIGDKKLVSDKWDESIGLFQIRSLKNPSAFGEVDKLRQKDKLFNPIFNAKAAYEISKKGRDWTPWTVFNNDSYKRFLPENSEELLPLANIRGRQGRTKPLFIQEAFDENDFVDLSFMQAQASISPDDQNVLDRINSGELVGSAIDEALRGTSAYKNLADRQRAALALQKNDPASFKALVENTRDSIRQLFIDYGAETNKKTINKLANRAIFYDLKKSQLATIVSNSINFESNFLKGIAGKTADEIRKVAYEYGVTLPQNSPGLIQSVKDIITQKRTIEDITIPLRESAISKFPAFKSRFEAGETWRDVANPYIDTLENVWELAKGSVGLNDSLLGRIMQGVNPKDGSPFALNLFEASRLAKQDPRWQNTAGAQEEILGALTGVLRDFGEF